MAVLKRGDNDERLQLDASRRFAASLALAWRLWVTHFTAFMRLMWLPCVLSVVVVVLWLQLTPSVMSSGLSLGSVLVDVAAGAAMLFVWSMMRTLQLEALADIEAGESINTTMNLNRLWNMLSQTWRPYLPLLAAWLLAAAMVYVPMALGANIYVLLACGVAAVMIPPTLGGMAQSFMEVKSTPLFGRMWQGLKLNRHYWGSMASMWVLSLLVMVVIATVLIFGVLILGYAFANKREAVMQEEVIEIPAYVGLLIIAVEVVVVWLLSFTQSLWSLPQQVHMRSILYKKNNKQNNT